MVNQDRLENLFTNLNTMNIRIAIKDTRECVGQDTNKHVLVEAATRQTTKRIHFNPKVYKHSDPITHNDCHCCYNRSNLETTFEIHA
jgi:hypothetical protein